MSIFATMFRRSPETVSEAGPAPAEMRGRAAEISDAGGLSWEVVWEALKTEPPAEDPPTLTYELGLDQEREITDGYNAEFSGTEFSGTRHGRHVTLRIGVIPGIRGKAYNEVHVLAAVPAFRLRVEDGRIAADAGAPPEVEEVLGQLAPGPETWRGLEVEGGPDEIVARRPITARGNQRGYVYDLWLVERLAERLG
jgi:hypothetical protein